MFFSPQVVKQLSRDGAEALVSRKIFEPGEVLMYSVSPVDHGPMLMLENDGGTDGTDV